MLQAGAFLGMVEGSGEGTRVAAEDSLAEEEIPLAADSLVDGDSHAAEETLVGESLAEVGSLVVVGILAVVGILVEGGILAGDGILAAEGNFPADHEDQVGIQHLVSHKGSRTLLEIQG